MITSTHYVVRTETRPETTILETVYRSRNPEAAWDACRRLVARDRSRHARYQILATTTPPPFATTRYIFD